MDGGLQGASAFWSTASQSEVVSFFRHLGEDVSELDSAALQVARRLAFERLPRLSNRALRVSSQKEVTLNLLGTRGIVVLIFNISPTFFEVDNLGTNTRR